jgi:D-glycero-alpha-D-manno-heptose-7-phosphate kinase
VLRPAYQKVRARAPLRLGLAGGSTDLSHYAEIYGGAVLNATIDRYAHVSLSLIYGDELMLEADDLEQVDRVRIKGMRIDEGLILHRAVYSRIARDFFGGRTPAVKLETMIDAPAGSGLGSSSALVVAMVGAFRAAFDLPLGPYDVAKLAFEIERKDLALAGGRQDQYAAAFGGVNFIEFLPDERVIVNPLRLPAGIGNEMMSSIVICSTGQSRASHQIIVDQTANATSGVDSPALDAMHQLKQDAFEMKSALLAGDIAAVAQVLNRSWIAKKATSKAVTTDEIERLWAVAHEHGAMGGKVSGAGGGGFLMFITEPQERYRLLKALREAGAAPDTVHFSNEGVEAWVVER